MVINVGAKMSTKKLNLWRMLGLSVIHVRPNDSEYDKNHWKKLEQRQ